MFGDLVLWFLVLPAGPCLGLGSVMSGTGAASFHNLVPP